MAPASDDNSLNRMPGQHGHPSPTPSEEGGVKGEIDIDDDPNSALISQSLNADGTPKRPMNAFMIFARRRRPQVSAENQSMRTGDISKILSREWNSMPAEEKQFFLDQAKHLKDNFNTKYPDYVYRRRPNNTRRKRRIDVSPRLPEDALTPDGREDYAANADSGEISPVDEEGRPIDMHYSRAADISQSYGSYTFPNENAFRAAGTPNARLSHTSNDERFNSLAALPPSRMPQAGSLPALPLLVPHHDVSQAAAFSADAMNSSDNWSSRIWPGPGSPPSSLPRSISYSQPQVTWNSTSTTSITHSYPAPPFPQTFAPGYHQPSDAAPNGTSPPYSNSSQQSMRPASYVNGRDYHDSSMASSPPISPSVPFPENNLMPYMGRTNGRSPPSNIQSISSYSQSQVNGHGSTNSSPHFSQSHANHHSSTTSSPHYPHSQSNNSTNSSQHPNPNGYQQWSSDKNF